MLAAGYVFRKDDLNKRVILEQKGIHFEFYAHGHMDAVNWMERATTWCYRIYIGNEPMSENQKGNAQSLEGAISEATLSDMLTEKVINAIVVLMSMVR
jgi:hypothetical protein